MSRLLAALCASLTAASMGFALRQDTARPAEPPPDRAYRPGTADHGQSIYESAGCRSCHAASLDEETTEGPIRAGHPLEGAAYRGSWWSNRINTDAGEASEFCRQSFVDPQGAPFTAQERKALVLFMQRLGDRRGISPLVLLRRDAGDVDLSAGDPGRGAALYARACLSCHGEARQLAQGAWKNLSPAELAGVIRRGTGTMPFFQVDRLPAAQVADVAAHLESLQPRP